MIVRRSFAALFVTALAALVVALCAAAQPAVALVWEEGTTGHPFTLIEPISPAVAVLGGDDARLELARLTLTDINPGAPMWVGFPAGKRPDPRMAYPLPGGHLLISGGKDVPYVMEVNRSGVVTWEYENGTDGMLRKPFSAEPATFGGRDCILISDRIACRVFAVTRDTKEIVWQYGTTDVPGAGVEPDG